MRARSWSPTILITTLLLLATDFASAQLNVDLQLGRRDFLLHESIAASIRLTNRAGQTLDLYGDSKRPWLNFVVTDERGTPLRPYGGQLDFQRAKVPVGRSVARQVDLASLFPIGATGRYTAYAIVNLPTGETFQSDRESFTVTKGRLIYQQRVGLGKKAREYRLMTFNPGRVEQLYFQAEIIDGGKVALTYPIGEILSFRKPQATVDNKGKLHVLYLARPEHYSHILIDDRGRVSKRTLFKRGSTGDPRLVAFKNGEVQVVGGIVFDPKKQAKEKAKIRRISERPPILFD